MQDSRHFFEWFCFHHSDGYFEFPVARIFKCRKEKNIRKLEDQIHFVLFFQLEDADFDILLKYLEGLQGKGRQQTINKAEKLMSKDEPSSDANSDNENNETDKKDEKATSESKSKYKKYLKYF